MYHEDSEFSKDRLIEVTMDLMAVAPAIYESLLEGLHNALPQDLSPGAYERIHDNAVGMVNRAAFNLHLVEPISRCRCEKCCISHALDTTYTLVKEGRLSMDDCETSVSILEGSIKACCECPRLEDTEI